MFGAPSTQPVGSTYLKGALFGLAAASIWAGWSAITRLAVTTNLNAWDIAALRFGVAGVLLLPVVVKRGLALDRIGWRGLAAIVICGGAPYVLLAAAGLRYAPAFDQGALNPGVMPLFVALISATVLRERLIVARNIGLACILAGVLVLAGWHARDERADWVGLRTFGHLLFLSAAFLWAGFTVIMRQARLDPLHAAALVSTGSLVAYFPIYLVFHGAGLAQASPTDLIIQAIFQGVLVTVVSLLLYGRSVAILGAPGGAAFGALVPALSAVLAIPLLGEWPGGWDWVAILLISVGVYVASGGPLPKLQ